MQLSALYSLVLSTFSCQHQHPFPSKVRTGGAQVVISQPGATIGCLAICRTTLKMIRSLLRKHITFDAVRKLLKKKKLIVK